MTPRALPRPAALIDVTAAMHEQPVNRADDPFAEIGG